MADNVTVDNGGLTDYAPATDEVTHSGDAAHVQLMRPVLTTGAEGSKTVVDLTGDATYGLDVDVTRLPALPAGTNNIGDVDVLTLPNVTIGTMAALVAGTANIGDVDVLTVPAPLSTTGGGTEATALRVTLASDSTGLVSVDDNAGSLTVDAPVGTPVYVRLSDGSTAIATLPVSLASLPALAAGTANIGDVDVLSLPALAAGANNIGDVDVLTVPAPLSTTGGGTEATALRVTIASDSTGVVTVDDGGGSLTVDGTVAVSGTVTVAAHSVDVTGQLLGVSSAVTDSWSTSDSLNDTTPTFAVLGYSSVVGVFATDGGTCSAGAIVFEVSPDSGTTWAEIAGIADQFSYGVVYPLVTMDLTQFAGTPYTFRASWDVAGMTHFRARISTAITGTLDVALRFIATSAPAPDVAIAAKLNSGTAELGTVYLAAGTATNEVVGDVAHDAAAAGNPVMVAGVAQAGDDTAPPNRVSAEGDATRFATDFDGAVYVRPHGPQIWSYHLDTSTAQTDTTVHAAPGSGLALYVTSITFSSGSATAINAFFEEGSTKVLGPYYLEAVAGRGMHLVFPTPKKISANTALTMTTSASIAHCVDVVGFIGQG